jgi:hypothetical protein
LPLVLLLLSLAVFFVASLAMSRHVEPFYSWYFCFAWWCYIVALESLLALRGGYSTLFERPGRFFLLLPVSVTVWLIFEAYNFRLGNWHYLNLPESTPLRWAGYLLSYATVLPALSVTRRLFEFMGILEDRKTRPLENPTRFLSGLTIAGLVMLALPLIVPQYAFPLIWAGFLFLLEPIAYRAGARSLLADWESGSLRQLWLLLMAGLVCGLLWETWNFWSGAKWFYTVPFVGDAKLFEMPLLGYLGFPIFAVECWVMGNVFDALSERIDKLGNSGRAMAWAALGLAATVFAVAVMTGIDRWTVVSLAG